MSAAKIQLPDKLAWVFSEPSRYKAAHGGRGSGKTMGFALMTAVYGYQAGMSGDSGAILCGRQHLNSLDDSSLEEVKSAIRSVDWLYDYYEIGEKYIRSKDGRIRYIFSGLDQNLDSIKSKAKVLVAWVDEAEGVSERAWRKLRPSVRAPGSEIWITWNPEASDAPTTDWLINNPPSDLRMVQVNYDDNPWFPPELDQERQDDLQRDPDMYRHIWLGETISRTDAQVFNKRWRIEAFDESLAKRADRFYLGADFGFAMDPSTLIRCFVLSNKLFIDYEAYEVGVEIDDMPAFYDQVPGARKWPIKADSARPETISYLKRKGFNINAAEKWPGCIEDGIAHIKGFDEIVIHERCSNTAREFSKYSYKVDKQTDEVLPKIVDKHNHAIDALRYAMDGTIQRRGSLGMWSRLSR